MSRSLSALSKRAQGFVKVRDWDKFHTPKNLVMALAVEAAELLEQFQWLTAEESQQLSSEARADVADEIADVQIYLLILASRLEIDVEQAVEAKMAKNAAKYPVGAPNPWESDKT